MPTSLSSVAILAVATVLVAGAPALAASNRVWVSGHGVDQAGCGSPTSPCRSLQYAHDNIAPGGEIDILDPAGYGAITITKAVSIVNDGGVAGVQQASAGQDAILINAGATDAVTLRGLTIEGLGAANDGIAVSGAGKLTVINCVIRHFAHDGVRLQPSTGLLVLSVLGTIAADNGANGFEISPTGQGQTQGILDHIESINNGVDGLIASGLNTSTAVFVTLSDSDFSNNANAGVYSKGAGTGENALIVTRNVISDYNTYGFYVDSNSAMYFSHAEALVDLPAGNIHGSDISVFLSGNGIGYTYNDNSFAGTSGALTPQSPF